MLFLKVVAAVAASACALLAALIGRGEGTTRTRHSALFWVFIAVSLLSMLTVVGLILTDNWQAETAAAERQKQAETAAAEREALLEEVQDLGAQLAPFIEVATALYPAAGREEALRLLTSRIDSMEERTEALELQLRFQPLDPVIRAEVVDQLRTVASEIAARGVSVSVWYEGGNNPRMQIGAEIVEILAEAGYSTTGPTSRMTIHSGPPASVVIGYSPSCEDLANMIYGALRLVLKTEFGGERLDDEQDECGFILTINGDPLFNSDGTVEFR